MRTLKDELKKKLKGAGFRVDPEPPPGPPLIPGEVELETRTVVNGIGKAIYRPPRKTRPHRHRHGRVKVTEVKKHMEKRPFSKESLQYAILSIMLRENRPVTVPQLEKWLPVGTKKASIMGALVKFCHAGVTSVTEVFIDGNKQYSISDVDRRLGTDALYVKFLEYTNGKRVAKKTVATKPGKAATIAPVQTGFAIPPVINVVFSGKIEHVITINLKLGK